MSDKKEIRIMSGRVPVDWEIPVEITYSGEFASVVPACYLLSTHREALESALNVGGKRFDQAWSVKSDWITARAKVPKTQKANPEDYFSWGKEKTKAQIKRDLHPTSKDRAEFLDSLHESGAIGSRNELEMQWYQFCQHALNQLLVERKPVDMYFLKLHPCPYRPNWKAVLLSRFKNMGKLFCQTTDEKREALLMESGFTEELLNMDLLAYSKEGYCYLTVEVEHRPSWWKMVRKAELSRILKQKTAGYAKSFLNYVKQQIPISTRVYVGWLNAISRISPGTSEGVHASAFSFIPNRGGSERYFERPPLVDCPAVVPNKLPFAAGTNHAKALLETYAGVPEMPDLQQKPEDLRLRGIRAKESTIWVNGTTGLPLLHADQSDDAGKLLDPQQDTGSEQKGMA